MCHQTLLTKLVIKEIEEPTSLAPMVIGEALTLEVGEVEDEVEEIQKPTCHVYSKVGHTVVQCFYRFDKAY